MTKTIPYGRQDISQADVDAVVEVDATLGAPLSSRWSEEKNVLMWQTLSGEDIWVRQNVEEI